MIRKKSLEHFYQDPRDRMEILDTPAGPVDIVLLNNRQDFEVFLRNMMAAKDGPSVKIPKTQGAATLVAFNWPKIHAHKQAFLMSEALKGNRNPDWNAEFKRFKADKSNYQDFLVVLSVGPYSAVSAETVGLSEEDYTDELRPDRINHILALFEQHFKEHIGSEPFEMIAILEGMRV